MQPNTERSYRVYVAAASTPDQIDRATRCAIHLSKAGVRVVSTWTHTVNAVGAGNPRDASLAQRREWAADDLIDLASADALWLLAPPPGVTTRGAWVELGAAYARAQLIVSSGDTAQSIFSALGNEYETDEAALRALLVAAAGRRVP